MAISPTYTGQVYDSSTTTAKTTGNTTGMGQDAFLKMFMAQMTHQDPLNPMDNTQFTAQLAQFSSLEQLTKINKSLEGISSLPDALAQSQALGYLGKAVTFSGNQILATDDQVSGSSYTLASAASVKVIVQNSSGQTVYEKDLGQQTAGAHDFQWNGYTDAGKVAPNGTYTLYVVATNSQGNAVKVSDQQMTAQVTGYKKGTDGKGYLMVGSNTVALDKVVAVKQVTTKTASSQTSDSSSSSLSDSALAYIKSLLGLSS
ncbi:MAG: flagellar hook assembly protein FlgD [Desulfarculus sp.]|nr:flagellar hook assembly protein FlgD [Desulfarculus sp.]